MSATSITADQMRQHLATDTACPLLPEGLPGPVRHDGAWWIIPAGQHDYVLVTDPALARKLDVLAARLDVGLRAVTAAAESASPGVPGEEPIS